VASRQHSTELVVLLGALTAFTPLSVDMYLPALPALGAEFGASAGHVQLSVASFFLGLAVGQAFYGPLSDRFGRTRPLYIGLSLFVLASIGCALAPSMDFLIAARFFQALGACAGQVIARAIVRDLFEPKEAVQVFSLLVLVMGVSPVLAPIAGSQMLGFFEWRAIFWVIAMIGVLGLAGTLIRLHETHLKERAPISLSSVLSVYGLLLRDRAFVGYVVTGGMAMAGMFAYIVGSPYVFIEYFRVTPGRFGFIFGINALGLVLAAQLNARLVRRDRSEGSAGSGVDRAHAFRGVMERPAAVLRHRGSVVCLRLVRRLPVPEYHRPGNGAARRPCRQRLRHDRCAAVRARRLLGHADWCHPQRQRSTGCRADRRLRGCRCRDLLGDGSARLTAIRKSCGTSVAASGAAARVALLGLYPARREPEAATDGGSNHPQGMRGKKVLMLSGWRPFPSRNASSSHA
jgi:Bcr/CflA subfamily drug resistance transporter